MYIERELDSQTVCIQRAYEHREVIRKCLSEPRGAPLDASGCLGGGIDAATLWPSYAPALFTAIYYHSHLIVGERDVVGSLESRDRPAALVGVVKVVFLSDRGYRRGQREHGMQGGGGGGVEDTGGGRRYSGAGN